MAYVYGTSGDDDGLLGPELNGTSGDDVIVGYAGMDVLRGRKGADVLHGGEGDDVLLGGAGIDELLGGNGADLLNGGSDNDRMVGGLGDDIYRIDSMGDIVVEKSGEGNDLVRATISASLAQLSDFVERLKLVGSDDIDGTGNALSNEIEGNAGANALWGLDGDDTLIGGDGDDMLDGGVNHDILKGGNGNDILLGGVGDDTLLGQSDNDLLRGGAGEDSLKGGAGRDILFGGNGNDWLMGGGGYDEIFGGAGTDLVYFEWNPAFVYAQMDDSGRGWLFEYGNQRDLVGFDVELVLFGGYLLTTIDSGVPHLVVNDDSFTVETFGSVTGSLIANDSVFLDSNGGLVTGTTITLTPNVSSAPAFGALTINSDGTFTYAPTGVFQGQDQFAYTITAPNGETDTGIVTIQITPNNASEFAGAVNLGSQTGAEFEFTRDANGRPTGLANVVFNLNIQALYDASSGDAADIVDRLGLFGSNSVPGVGSGNSPGPVKLYDAASAIGPLATLDGTVARIVDGQLQATFSAAALAGGLSGQFGFVYGYENYATVNHHVSLDPFVIPLDTISPSFGLASAQFQAGLNLIDDRDPSPVHYGVINGTDGDDGRIYVEGGFDGSTLPVEYILVLYGINSIYAYFQDAIADIVIALTADDPNATPWAKSEAVAGTAGDAGLDFGDIVQGTSGTDVIYGDNQLAAGNGGHGGDATDGGEATRFYISSSSSIPFPGIKGGAGGAGGAGGQQAYLVYGFDGNDVIFGGNGGDGGDGGRSGSNGFRGKDDFTDVLALPGGQGGIGGDGGKGGDSFYYLNGGAGDDTIIGGNGGDGGNMALSSLSSGTAGSASYNIYGGDGNDTIYGGKGGDGGKSVNTVGSTYIIDGGDGDDFIYGGALGETHDKVYDYLLGPSEYTTNDVFAVGQIFRSGSVLADSRGEISLVRTVDDQDLVDQMRVINPDTQNLNDLFRLPGETVATAIYKVIGGSGNDHIWIGAGDDDGSESYHLGTSLGAAFNAENTRTPGLYQVDGGTGDDVMYLPYVFSNDYRIDGGDGSDTLVFSYPDLAGGSRYGIDFTAAAFTQSSEPQSSDLFMVRTIDTPALRDMIDSVETFRFEGGSEGIDVKLSGVAIQAMTSFDGLHYVMHVETAGDVTITLADGASWQVVAPSSPDVLYNAAQNVFLYVDDMSAILFV